MSFKVGAAVPPQDHVLVGDGQFVIFFFKGKTSGFVMKLLVNHGLNHGVARDLNDQPELFPFQTCRNTFGGDLAFTNSKRGYRFQCLILIGPTTKVQ